MTEHFHGVICFEKGEATYTDFHDLLTRAELKIDDNSLRESSDNERVVVLVNGNNHYHTIDTLAPLSPMIYFIVENEYNCECEPDYEWEPEEDSQ